MTALQALLWDVDGTLAETERDGHRVAFNQAFEAHGLRWRWDESHYGRLLDIAGGRERVLRFLAGCGDAPPLAAEREALATSLHRQKNAFYAELVRQRRLPLRAGVAELIDECGARGVLLAIATTSSRSNVEALMASAFGASWARRFAVVLCGEDVARKKPDPEVYAKALAALGVTPLHAVALEDSPGGVAAARAAGIPVVVTRSHYFARRVIEGALAIGPGLHRREGWRPALAGIGRVTLDDIAQWRGPMEQEPQTG